MMRLAIRAQIEPRRQASRDCHKRSKIGLILGYKIRAEIVGELKDVEMVPGGGVPKVIYSRYLT